MSRLLVIKLLAEIVDLGTRAYGTVVDRELAKKNRDRDDKIKALQAEVDELKKRVK